jgi:alkanesulfonate monooxygenase SsuD/methylene tetrahydromethanopterin reductase-like flavin-dependent oxidoreductase (luciferase family)
MKVGVQLVFQNHKDYSDRDMYKHELRLAIDSEAMGYDTLWPVEHHFFDYSMCPDNLQYLSYVAARTEKLELGTAAIIVPWNDPMRVVEKVVLLDHLSDGRAVLGLGRGLSRREYRGFGIDMSETRDRFNEAVEIILQGVETGFVEADSKYFKQARVEVRPRPFKTFKGRRAMVCMSPDSFEVAAANGLGAMMFSQMGWNKVADNIWAYREDYRKKNNGEEAPPVVVNDFIICHADRKKAEELARRYIVGYYWSVMEHYEMGGTHFADTGKSYAHYAKGAEIMKSVGQDAIIEDFLNANLWGDPDLIVQKLRQRRELIGDFAVNGVFSFQSLPFAEVESGMRLFAREVAPEVKSWQPQERRQPVDVAVSTSGVAAK